MNILILPCSPRKGGNSDTLCRALAEGVAETGHSVAVIYPREKTLSYYKKNAVGFAHRKPA